MTDSTLELAQALGRVEGAINPDFIRTGRILEILESGCQLKIQFSTGQIEVWDKYHFCNTVHYKEPAPGWAFIVLDTRGLAPIRAMAFPMNPIYSSPPPASVIG